MCGINLIVSRNQDDLKPMLHRMMEKTSFRGPDAEGEAYFDWGDRQIALGANRLRIVDTDENSDQPLTSICGNYIIGLNGEIYNYQDLKSKLIDRGQEFRTHSDTEVVLYWLKHFGKSGLSSLKGMFSIAFINLKDKKILLARDHYGVKPLYFYHDENLLIASSSIKAIASTELVPRNINKAAVQEYLSFRHVLGQHSFYEKIDSVNPGTVFEVSSDGEYVSTLIKSDQDYEKKSLKEALIDSLALQTSGQSSGLLLSGGVDSTLLLAICRQELGYHGVPTFTLNTGEDSEWAAKAARKYDASHVTLDIQNEDREAAFHLFDTMDQPIADHGALATWLISRKVASNHRTLLSGAGADELFAGYNRHLAFSKYLRNKTTWLRYKKFASATGYIAYPRQLKQFLKSINISSTTTFEKFLSIHGITNNISNKQLLKQDNTPVDNMSQALDFDFRNYLVNDVLSITDVATMAHGVEARVPFLYNDVVLAANQISIEDKLRNSGKAPLKDLLSSYGGKAFARRRKMGFGLPMGRWLRSKESKQLWSIVIKDDPVFEYVDGAIFQRMKAEHLSGKKDWNMQLWSILVLSYWLKNA